MEGLTELLKLKEVRKEFERRKVNSDGVKGIELERMILVKGLYEWVDWTERRCRRRGKT